jgi:hypothetical protein
MPSAGIDLLTWTGNKNSKKVVQGSHQHFINQPNRSFPQTGRVLETPRPFGDTMPGWSTFPNCNRCIVHYWCLFYSNPADPNALHQAHLIILQRG